MSARQIKPDKMKGSAKLKLAGLFLAAGGLALGAYVLGTVVGAAGAAKAVPPVVLYIEAAAAVGIGLTGFALLVAGADPFEDAGSPLLQYENERHDSFDQ